MMSVRNHSTTFGWDLVVGVFALFLSLCVFVCGAATGLMLMSCRICIYYVFIYTYEYELAHHGHGEDFDGDRERVEYCDLL